MSLSFADSLKNNSEVLEVAEPAIMPCDAAPTIITLDENYAIAAYAGDDGSWTQDKKYDWYNGVYGMPGSLGYDDSDMSSIDAMKNVSLNPNQVNINQEHKSQFIPFEMPRYYDGYDLTNATICINYRRKDGNVRAKPAVNVRFNNEKIQFGWLVEAHATEIPGKLEFEIVAFGTDYIWKSRMVNNMNVIESLPWSDELISIESDDTWVSEIVAAVTEQIVGMEFNEQLKMVNEAVESAQNAAAQAESSATNAVTSALTNYSTTSEMQEYVTDAISNADIDNKMSEYAKKSDVESLVGNIGDSENVVSYIETAIKSVDVTDQLTNYVTTENLQDNYYDKLGTYNLLNDTLDEKGYATTLYVDDAIKSADLDSYYKKTETYNKSEIDELLDNVSVDLTGYATEIYVDNKVAPLSSSISTNAENLSSLSTTVGNLQGVVNSIDTSPRLTYDVVYNDVDDADVGENVFVLYEITNEGKEDEVKEAKRKFTIVGGSGGNAGSSSLKIGYVTTSPLVVTINDKAIIKYTFSGTDSSGDAVPEGVATWKVAGRIVATNTALAGENTFDITEYLTIGTQKVNLQIVDEGGSLVTKTWTVQKIDVRLESTFNDKIVYPVGAVSFDYTPYGAVSKDVHFVLDGKEIGKVTTTSSGIPMSYEIPAQTHGSHLLEVYMTAEINGNFIESNYIVKDIMWHDAANSTPIISTIYQNFVARQYDSTNIEYTVYDPTTETPTVEIAVDGVVVSSPKLETSTNIYTFKTDDIGEHIITITCGKTVKTITATITKLDINVAPVTSGLAFDFNPSGKSNNDADRVWSNGTVSMSVSDNFDWVNGGYQYDENGDQYFCVKSGTFATIDYQLFADDAKVNGKEFKVAFKTTNIKKRDTSFISCMNNGIGLDMKVEDARIYSSNNNLYSPYCEEDIIEFEFNINKNSDIPLVLTYEDGVGNRPMLYTSDASFWQSTPQPITIGSDNCDVHIYRMKAYTRSLSDSEILANFIADARNADEMVSRYNRNQIYNENSMLTPEVLAEKCPDLRIIMVDAPWFTNDKDNKVDDTTIRMIYKNGDAILDNWTCTGARHSGQGTSSNEYGYAGRNIDLIMDGDTSLFTFGDGSTGKTITLTRDSVPTDYLNVKVNIASSENQNNAQMARRYNQYNPFVRYAKFNDPKVKDCMEFYNCVIFVKERDTDIATHREFQDNEYHFYAIGNVGDSKKTDDTRVNDKNDPKEFVLEITDYNVPLAEFPTGVDGDICTPANWKAGNTAYDLLYAEYQYKEGKFKSFGSKSYEFRYEMKGLTEEQREVNINAWRDFYKFVVTSTDEEFYSKLKEYFVVDSALYYYLFTERYTMVDNRAKNSFWHYGKVYITEAEAVTLGDAAGGYTIDNVQAAINNGYRFDLAFGYDFDRAMSK